MIEVRETLEKNVHIQKSICGRIQKVFRQMFENTCQAIEQVGGERFIEHSWIRDTDGIWISGKNGEDKIYVDRALHNGKVFEKVGVNYVAIEGELPPAMSFEKSGALATKEADRMSGDKSTPYLATGTSFVIHPRNPMVPIAHVNYRYFQIGNGNQPDYWWFGGGADLTAHLPIDDNTTVIKRIFYRSLLPLPVLDGFFRKLDYKLSEEDAAIVSTLHPQPMPPISEELHVAADALGLAYRKLRQQHLAMGWGIKSDIS